MVTEPGQRRVYARDVGERQAFREQESWLLSGSSYSCWWSVSGCSWLQARSASRSSRMRRFMFFSILLLCDSLVKSKPTAVYKCIDD